MGQRAVIGLESNADAESIKRALQTAGAESVRGPAPEQPDVLIVTVGAADLGEFLRRAAKLPGVRYAEPDAWQSTF